MSLSSDLLNKGYSQGADGPSVDVVILAGTIGNDAPWTRGTPRALLPLAGTTVIDALLARIESVNAASRTICANGHTSLFRTLLTGDGTAASRFGFVNDSVPLGPAGCLKACQPRLGGRTILLSGASVWLEDDPTWMVAEHQASGNALTVFCAAASHDDLGGARRVLRPTGVYCCDPVVMDYINTVGFQDVKEQLIPALRKQGLHVGVVTLRKPAFEITEWSSYIRAVGRAIAGLSGTLPGYRPLTPDVWCGRNVQIAANARIVGPVMLGRNCRVEEGAVIIGPTMLGNESRVGKQAWVMHAVSAGAANLPPGIRVVDELLSTGQHHYPRADRAGLRSRTGVPSVLGDK